MTDSDNTEHEGIARGESLSSVGSRPTGIHPRQIKDTRGDEGGGDEGGGDEGGGDEGGGDQGGGDQVGEDDPQTVKFTDDEGMTFDAQEILNSINVAKQSCAQSGVRANDAAAFLVIVGAASAVLGPVAIPFIAMVGISSGVFWMMGNRAQECVNDPPRNDFNLVTEFHLLRETPASPMPQPSPVMSPGAQTAVTALASAVEKLSSTLSAINTTLQELTSGSSQRPVISPRQIRQEPPRGGGGRGTGGGGTGGGGGLAVPPAAQTAITALANAAAQSSNALSAITITIERFQGARAAKIAGQPGGLHGVSLQGTALTRNASGYASQLASIQNAGTSFAAAWTPSVGEAAAAAVAQLAPSRLAEAITSTWQAARGQAESQYNLSATDLSMIDGQMAHLSTQVGNGTITMAQVTTMIHSGISVDSITSSGAAFNAVANAFMTAAGK